MQYEPAGLGKAGINFVCGVRQLKIKFPTERKDLKLQEFETSPHPPVNPRFGSFPWIIHLFCASPRNRFVPEFTDWGEDQRFTSKIATLLKRGYRCSDFIGEYLFAWCPKTSGGIPLMGAAWFVKPASPSASNRASYAIRQLYLQALPVKIDVESADSKVPPPNTRLTNWNAVEVWIFKIPHHFFILCPTWHNPTIKNRRGLNSSSLVLFKSSTWTWIWYQHFMS